MKQFILFMTLTACVACSVPGPVDEVRTLRRQYKLEGDFSLSNETGKLSIEVKLQNLSSGDDLQDLTVIMELFDADQKVVWSKQETLDITGLASYANKSFDFGDTIENPEAVDAFSVRLAPDEKESDYKSYKEFMRVM